MARRPDAGPRSRGNQNRRHPNRRRGLRPHVPPTRPPSSGNLVRRCQLHTLAGSQLCYRRNRPRSA